MGACVSIEIRLGGDGNENSRVLLPGAPHAPNAHLNRLILLMGLGHRRIPQIAKIEKLYCPGCVLGNGGQRIFGMCPIGFGSQTGARDGGSGSGTTQGSCVV